MSAESATEYVEWRRRYLGANRSERIRAEIEADRFPLSKSSGALVNSLVVSTGGGLLFGLSGFSSKASPQYVQVFDAVSVPADGAVPVLVIYVLATENFSLDYGDVGRNFLTGIVVCNSSTAATKTIGSADTWLDVQYV